MTEYTTVIMKKYESVTTLTVMIERKRNRRGNFGRRPQ